jgi:pyruvate/2-oxoacid:ferredoxin oxidoreductase beta subunit
MTGGQMAPTTLPEMKTETTPYGRKVEETGYPTQGPEMVAAITQTGAYSARATISNFKQMKRYIKKALENQMNGNGFSFVEVLSACPTNWSTNNEQTWNFVEKEMTKYFKVGEIKVPDAGEAVAGRVVAATMSMGKQAEVASEISGNLLQMAAKSVGKLFNQTSRSQKKGKEGGHE